jgi:nucleotide-binding universal stress UspA family protein
MPQKIVVGYDGSEIGQSALDFAVDLAKARGAGLVLAHVLE